MPIYTAKLPTVQKVMKALSDANLHPVIVGSVATRGISTNDIDILVDHVGTHGEFPDDVMLELGFQDITPRDVSKGNYWRSPGGLSFDLFERK